MTFFIQTGFVQRLLVIVCPTKDVQIAESFFLTFVHNMNETNLGEIPVFAAAYKTSGYLGSTSLIAFLEGDKNPWFNNTTGLTSFQTRSQLTCASPLSFSRWGLKSSKNVSPKFRNRPYKRNRFYGSRTFGMLTTLDIIPCCPAKQACDKFLMRPVLSCLCCYFVLFISTPGNLKMCLTKLAIEPAVSGMLNPMLCLLRSIRRSLVPLWPNHEAFCQLLSSQYNPTSVNHDRPYFRTNILDLLSTYFVQTSTWHNSLWICDRSCSKAKNARVLSKAKENKTTYLEQNKSLYVKFIFPFSIFQR